MPWRIEKRDKKFCVIKETDDSVEKCHLTKAKASAHMKALYASENKELNMKTEATESAKEKQTECGDGVETKETHSKGEYWNNAEREWKWIPWSVTTFADLETYEDASNIAKTTADLTGKFKAMIDNILDNEEVTNKANAIKSLSDELETRLKEVESGGALKESKEELQTKAHEMVASITKDADVPHQTAESDDLLTRITDAVKSAVKSLFKEKDKEGEDFILWKEKDGQMRWLAAYSNNFRDDDKPAEIISSASHRRFVELTDKGLTDMPILEIWHVPQWKIGAADWVAYDDAGVALASGTIDKDKEHIAEWISHQKGVRLSHGMPKSKIKRDPDDSTIIVEHVTQEISILPDSAAANKFTGWKLLGDERKSKEDESMAIPAEKLDALVSKWGADPETLKDLEKKNEEIANAAKEEGRESKEKETEQADSAKSTESKEEEQVTEEAQAETETEETQSETEKAPDYPTRQEIVEGFAPVLSEMRDQMNALSAQVGELSKEIKSLKETDETKIAEKAQEAPAASIAALLGQHVRAVGAADTKLKEGDLLSSSKPKETEPLEAKEGPTVVPFLNTIITQKRDGAK